MQREEHQRLFGDTRTRSIGVTVLEETYQAALHIAAENKWDESYANQIIFANGVSFLQGKLALERVNSGQAKADEAIERLTKDVQQYIAMYSVMKYQAFMKTQDNEVMDFQLNVYKNENALLKERNDLFRKDEERLKGELARLRAENEALHKKLDQMQAAGTLAHVPESKDADGVRFPRWRIGRLWRHGRRER